MLVITLDRATSTMSGHMQVLDLGSSMAPRRRAWHVLPLICRYVHDAAAAAVTWPRPRATGLIHGSLFVNRSRSIEHRDGCSLHLYVCTHAKNKACMYPAAAVCGHVVNSSSTNRRACQGPRPICPTWHEFSST